MDQIRVQTEQLRIEAQVSRKKVSEVSKDLIEYCEREKPHDMLVSGPIDNHNPFQEKKSCAVL
uniref:Guanine nucleotide-binding protein subunit gamma n=1 Tax=Setaria digitata TaxID=48799 RepID=A0A915Q2N8_9BILA